MTEDVDDLRLPPGVVAKIMKDSLPPGTIVSKDARIAVTRAAAVFVLNMTTYANEYATSRKRKLVTAEDVLHALHVLECDHIQKPEESVDEGNGQRTTPSFGDDDNPITVRFHCRRNGCCDQHEWCRFWASVGECRTNAEWMISNCELACGTCKRPPTFVTSPSRAPAVPSTRGTVPTRRPPPRTRPSTRFTTRLPASSLVPLILSSDTSSSPVSVSASASVFSPTPSTPSFVTPFKPHKRTRFFGISRRLPGSSPEPAIFPSPSPSPITTPATTPFPAITTENTFFTSPTSTETITTTSPVTTTTFTTTTTTRFTFRPQTHRPFFFRPFTGTRSTSTTTSTPFFTRTTSTPKTTTTTTSQRPTSSATTTSSSTTSVPTPAPAFPSQFVPSFSDVLDSPDSLASSSNQTTEAPTTRSSFSRADSFNVARCREILSDPIVAAEEMWREKLVETTEDVSRRRTVDLDQVIRSNLANACVPRLDESDCESNICYNVLFRTMDGTCNNLQEPLRAASYRPYTRLLPTVYDNDLSEPVGSMFPQSRPPPRAITRKLTSSEMSIESTEFNALIMQFGQFISHDMAKTTLVPSSKCNVCQNITSRCMSVPLERDEPNQNFRRTGCIRVSRSSPICGSGRTKPRQQLNENTGYIDASPIYGSSLHDSKKFRNGNTGFLKLPMFNGMLTLPFDQSKCRSRNNCNVVFTAGDSRVNLFVGLSAWHTVFTREHNRIANVLTRLNPHWSGDRVYLESRKIVGAQVQAIVYREWLPKILGAAFSSVVGDYHGYDPTIDSTIANEFTSAAFRFGHGMLQEVYQRLDTNFRNISFGALSLQHGTLHSDVLLNEGGVDPLIRGMFSQHVKRPQRVAMTISENMFSSTDLSSINIQRGRDHGHQSYTKYRELCGMDNVNDFEDLSREILHPGTRKKLREVYGNVHKMDLWVGALLEDPVIRGLVGPTVACIVGPQFRRTRDGDRFYYENPGVFTRRQLSEIRKSSLSRIICDNTNTITMIPREAFRVGHLVPCSQIPHMDLNHWIDR